MAWGPLPGSADEGSPAARDVLTDGTGLDPDGHIQGRAQLPAETGDENLQHMAPRGEALLTLTSLGLTGIWLLRSCMGQRHKGSILTSAFLSKSNT